MNRTEIECGSLQKTFADSEISLVKRELYNDKDNATILRREFHSGLDVLYKMLRGWMEIGVKAESPPKLFFAKKRVVAREEEERQDMISHSWASDGIPVSVHLHPQASLNSPGSYECL